VTVTSVDGVEVVMSRFDAWTKDGDADLAMQIEEGRGPNRIVAMTNLVFLIDVLKRR
jgi:hypothetical protein